VIIAPGPRWAYAATWPTTVAPPEGPIMIEIEIEVMEGAVGLGCLSADMGAFVGKEMMLGAAPGVQTARLAVPEAEAVGHLLLRNVAADGSTSRASLRAIRAARARPAQAVQSRVLDPAVRSFALDQVFDAAAAPRPGRDITILPVEEMGTVLGFPAPYVPGQIVHRYGLEDFKTEIDESDIYRYLYRELRPRRHLEFGTYEGFGVVLCASSCEAEIWTVNLPEGERDSAGAPRYGAQLLPGESSPLPPGVAGDAGERIGWRYRAAGYGSRVHQMLMDSRDFPVDEFPPGFFDTALIDGGHTPEVVASDTDVALRLVRAGGVIIWHDFCPDPVALLPPKPAEASCVPGWTTTTGGAANSRRCTGCGRAGCCLECEPESMQRQQHKLCVCPARHKCRLAEGGSAAPSRHRRERRYQHVLGSVPPEALRDRDRSADPGGRALECRGSGPGHSLSSRLGWSWSPDRSGANGNAIFSDECCPRVR